VECCFICFTCKPVEQAQTQAPPRWQRRPSLSSSSRLIHACSHENSMARFSTSGEPALDPLHWISALFVQSGARRRPC